MHYIHSYTFLNTITLNGFNAWMRSVSCIVEILSRSHPAAIWCQISEPHTGQPIESPSKAQPWFSIQITKKAPKSILYIHWEYELEHNKYFKIHFVKINLAQCEPTKSPFMFFQQNLQYKIAKCIFFKWGAWFMMLGTVTKHVVKYT